MKYRIEESSRGSFIPCYREWFIWPILPLWTAIRDSRGDVSTFDSLDGAKDAIRIDMAKRESGFAEKIHNFP